MTVVTVHVVEWTLCTETINVSSDSLSTYLYWAKNRDATGQKQTSMQHVNTSGRWTSLLPWLCSWRRHTTTFTVLSSLSWWWLCILWLLLTIQDYGCMNLDVASVLFIRWKWLTALIVGNKSTCSTVFTRSLTSTIEVSEFFVAILGKFLPYQHQTSSRDFQLEGEFSTAACEGFI